MLKMYKWVAQPIKKGQKKQTWWLINKDTGLVVLEICFSPYSKTKHDYWLRKKIQKAFELYDTMVFADVLRVY